jgi:hypothetical protein
MTGLTIATPQEPTTQVDQRGQSRQLLKRVLRMDRNHPRAADLLAETEGAHARRKGEGGGTGWKGGGRGSAMTVSSGTLTATMLF